MSKRKMPSKSQIFEYWQYKILHLPQDLDTCWACGFKSKTYRCHLKSRITNKREDKSPDDSVSNLMLLCKSCHNWQELICSGKYGRKKFIESIKEGTPFMEIRFRILHTCAEMMVPNLSNKSTMIRTK